MGKRRARGQLEIVVWEDPTSRSEWMSGHDVSMFMRDRTFVVHSVGWVIREDKKALALAATITDNSQYVGQIFRVPKTAILSRTRVKQPRG